MLKQQEAGRSSLLAAIMPSKDDGAGTDIFRPPPAYGQLRNTENRQRLRGFATASLMPPLRLIAVPPCSLSQLPDKDFYDRPTTCRLFQQSTGRDSVTRLPALSAHHRLALPGLVSPIFIVRLNITCALSANGHRLMPGA